MIREIAANQLLQEELAKTDPNLASVASFMNSVCGNAHSVQDLKETAQLLIQRGIKGRQVAGASVVSARETIEDVEDVQTCS